MDQKPNVKHTPIMTRSDLDSLTNRQYLEATVVPILSHGLAELEKERPPEPIKFIAEFLLKNKNNTYVHLTPTNGNPSTTA